MGRFLSNADGEKQHFRANQICAKTGKTDEGGGSNGLASVKDVIFSLPLILQLASKSSLSPDYNTV